MKYIQLFESFNVDITDDINLILVNLSDNTSKLIANGIKEDFNNTLLLYDLDIRGNNFDKEEAKTANLRLKDIGYQILQISKVYNESTWYALVIKSELYDKLKDNDVLFWSDLQWEYWHMNRTLSSSAKHCKVKLDENASDYDISIIDGFPGFGGNGPSRMIEFNVSFADLEIQEEYRFEDRCIAEMYLIWLQSEYFGMTDVFNMIK